MTSQPSCPCDLCDRDLLAELERTASSERQATARLIALLMEVDSRKLYAAQGFSSLFTYCVHVLHLSEHAAYLRIEAARTARRFPAILERLADGSLHLTAINLLGPHLTAANHDDLLCAATHKSKRDVEQLVARLQPQPDVPSIVRKLPAPALRVVSEPPRVADAPPVAEQPMNSVSSPVVTTPVPARPAVVRPITAERYKVQFTASRETHEKLRHVQDLMRHSNPTGDIAAIFDRALTLLLADLSKAKCGAVERPQVNRTSRPHARHIPAAVKREVWRRDGGRCAFRGEHGRCSETGFLEYHHITPYADGGEASVSNIQLRCRTHNQYEAQQWSGDLWPSQVRENPAHLKT